MCECRKSSSWPYPELEREERERERRERKERERKERYGIDYNGKGNGEKMSVSRVG